MSRPFYITTAIDYVNGKPHLGHAYEKIAADVIARWRRLRGDDVRFQTGTDEHGSKVQKKAATEGTTPQAFVDGLAPAFRKAWAALDIEYDRFIRTTDADHKQTVVKLLEAIHEAGYLFDQSYEGWYCTGCEGYKTDKDLVDGRCPDHPTTEPTWLEEDNLFFRLSAFEQKLIDHIEEHPEFIEPSYRRNEVLGLLKQGLQDISISRSSESVSWGIEIPFRDKMVVWVWYDALINYLSGAGYGTDDALYERFWPADVHLIGKDITRFHCVIWPAMLMAAGIPLPKQVFAHGWVLTAGEKMSKSSGIVVDPVQIAGKYGPDPLRWFLTEEVTFGRDGEFSWDRFEDVYTAHLCNGLGNLVSRTVNMAVKYFGGVPEAVGDDDTLRQLTAEVTTEAAGCYDRLELHAAAQSAWRIVTSCNEQIQAREPWKMAKDDSQRDELARFLYGLMEAIRVALVLLSPVMPRKTAEALAVLRAEASLEQAFEQATAWGGVQAGTELTKPQPLFPRLDQLLKD